MNASAVSEKIADRDCTEHPVLDTVLLKDFLIGDVVGEAIVCVALDIDAENVLDCRFVSELIARRSFAMIDAADTDELDTDRLTLCIGLFSYAAAFCIPSFDAKSFRRLFVLAWFKYFSTVLSLENNDAPAVKGFIS